jgi:hypothetical protein
MKALDAVRPKAAVKKPTLNQQVAALQDRFRVK